MHYFLVIGSNGGEVIQARTAERAMQTYKATHGIDSWVTECKWEGK